MAIEGDPDDASLAEPAAVGASTASLTYRTVPQARSNSTGAGASGRTGPRLRRPSLRTPTWYVGRPAAAVAGLVAGLVIALGIALAIQGCAAARGAASCGGGPGIALLLVLLVLGVLAGTVLLRAGASVGPLSTSLLGVGVLAVLVMVFLLGSASEWWMLIVVPLLSAATFVGSHWLSTAIAEPAPGAEP